MGSQPKGEGLLCRRWAPEGLLLVVGWRRGISRGLKPPAGGGVGGGEECGAEDGEPAREGGNPTSTTSWGGSLQARAVHLPAALFSEQNSVPEAAQFHKYPEVVNAAQGTEVPAPTSALCFWHQSTAQGMKNLYLAGSTSGELQLAHVIIGKVLWAGQEEGNKVYATDASVHLLDIDCAPGRPAWAIVIDAESARFPLTRLCR